MINYDIAKGELSFAPTGEINYHGCLMCYKLVQNMVSVSCVGVNDNLSLFMKNGQFPVIHFFCPLLYRQKNGNHQKVIYKKNGKYCRLKNNIHKKIIYFRPRRNPSSRPPANCNRRSDRPNPKVHRQWISYHKVLISWCADPPQTNPRPHW